MEKLMTRNFELGIAGYGNPDSERLAVVLPGRMESKDHSHIREHARYLGSRSLYAVGIDPPGTWGSPGNLDVYMTNLVQATNETIDRLGPRPTLLFGYSRGGTAAMVASLNPNVDSLIVVMSRAGGSPIDKISAGYESCRRERPDSDGIIEEFRLSEAYFADSALYDPVPYVSKSKARKLFIYGLEDDVVTANDVRQTFNQAAEPKFIQPVLAGHDYGGEPSKICLVNDVIGRFLDANSIGYKPLTPEQ